MDQAQRTEFFKRVKGERRSENLEIVTANWFKMTVTEVKGKRDNIQYRPLEVWKTQGFDPQKAVRSTDTKQDPLLGKLYDLLLTTKLDGIEERQEEGEKFSVTDGAVSAASPPAGWTHMPAGISKEQVNHIQKNKNTENSTSRTKRIS